MKKFIEVQINSKPFKIDLDEVSELMQESRPGRILVWSKSTTFRYTSIMNTSVTLKIRFKMKALIITMFFSSIALAENQSRSSISVDLFPIASTVTYSKAISDHFSMSFSPLSLNYLISKKSKAFTEPQFSFSLEYHEHFNRDSLYLKGTLLIPSFSEITNDSIFVPEVGVKYFLNEPVFIQTSCAFYIINNSNHSPEFILPLPSISFGTLI
ncbi:MAG: hypothetical protein AB8C84_13235 [Oligoflexales bacterium]